MNELLQQIHTAIDNLPGWCSFEKADWIARWIVTEKPTVLVELGVFGGRSLIAMGMSAQFNNLVDPTLLSSVYGIDPYTTSAAIEGGNDPEHILWWKRVQLEEIKKGAQDAIHDLGLDTTVALLCQRSADACESFCPETVSFLHIDANHSEENSVRDVQLWLPLVESGGIVLLDDVDWTSVYSARSLLGRQCKLIVSTETWEVYRKPNVTVLIV